MISKVYKCFAALYNI